MGNEKVRQLREVVRDVERIGWTVTRGRAGGHWKFYDRAGRFVTTSGGTPGYGRGWENFCAALRRAGYDPAPRHRGKPKGERGRADD